LEVSEYQLTEPASNSHYFGRAEIREAELRYQSDYFNIIYGK